MGLFTKEIAIDLGTANTIIIYNDKVVVDEPSIVAIERSSGKIIAVGKKAQNRPRPRAPSRGTAQITGTELRCASSPALLPNRKPA